MKKTAVAATLLLAYAAAAQAQSNVTIFGIVDIGVRQVNNTRVGSMKSVVSAGESSGRLGFRGTEDLGGGLSAGFWVETTIAGDTGVGGAGALPGTTAPQFWDRRAFVSLRSTTLGQIRLGRDYTPTFDLWADFDPFLHNGMGSSGQFTGTSRTAVDAFGVATLPRTDVRANNLVEYFLPETLGGVYGNLTASATEGGTAAGGGKTAGFRIGYKANAMNVSLAAYNITTDRAGNPKLKDLAVGGTYDFSVVKAYTAYRQFKYLNSKNSSWHVGAIVPVGAAEIIASYVAGNGSGRSVTGANIDADDGNKITLGFRYNLSKRTDIYGNIARVSNDGALASTIAGGPAGMPGGGTSKGIALGIRHRF